MNRLRTLRLSASDGWVDVRVIQPAPNRWLASADTTDGPSLGTGRHAIEAIVAALTEFADSADQLLESVPDDILYWR